MFRNVNKIKDRDAENIINREENAKLGFFLKTGEADLPKEDQEKIALKRAEEWIASRI